VGPKTSAPGIGFAPESLYITIVNLRHQIRIVRVLFVIGRGATLPFVPKQQSARGTQEEFRPAVVHKVCQVFQLGARGLMFEACMNKPVSLPNFLTKSGGRNCSYEGPAAACRARRE
jgi:hypothetical protein